MRGILITVQLNSSLQRCLNLRPFAIKQKKKQNKLSKLDCKYRNVTCVYILKSSALFVTVFIYIVIIRFIYCTCLYPFEWLILNRLCFMI